MNTQTYDFIIKANKIHNNKYDYTKADYEKWNVPIIIICKNHGEFSQSPNGHLSGRGCKLCGHTMQNLKKLKTKEDFIKDAILYSFRETNKSNAKYF